MTTWYTDSLKPRSSHATDIQFITDTLAPNLERPTERNHALKPQEQVLVALRRFASGSFLEVVGDIVAQSLLSYLIE